VEYGFVSDRQRSFLEALQLERITVMKNTMPVIRCLGLALALSGCASSLKTYNSNQESTPGVAVYSPVLVEITTVTDYIVDSQNSRYTDFCTDVTESRLEFLPLGEVSYINFDASGFAKSEFSLSFSDKSVLTGVSLNSDPEISENVEKVAGLLDSIVPLLAPSPAADAIPLGDEELTTQQKRDRYCIKQSSRVTSIRRRVIEN
jgi:hypothetical protein